MQKFLEIPTSKHSVDPEYIGEDYPCIVCGRVVRAANPWMIRVVEGGGMALSPEYHQEYDKLGDPGDLNFYPIGPDCLRRHPQLRAYAVKCKEMAEH